MGNYDELKQAISDVIKTNGNQEITGQIMQNTLLSIINIVGENATFAGIATPKTNPGTPDQNIFYIASENGIYSNFDSIELKNEVSVIINKNGNWKKIGMNIPTLEMLEDIELYATQLGTYNFVNPFNIISANCNILNGTVKENSIFNYNGKMYEFSGNNNTVTDCRIIMQKIPQDIRVGSKLRIIAEIYAENIPNNFFVEFSTLTADSPTSKKNIKNIYNGYSVYVSKDIEVSQEMIDANINSFILFLPIQTFAYPGKITVGRVYFGYDSSGSILGDYNTQKKIEEIENAEIENAKKINIFKINNTTNFIDSCLDFNSDKKSAILNGSVIDNTIFNYQGKMIKFSGGEQLKDCRFFIQYLPEYVEIGKKIKILAEVYVEGTTYANLRPLIAGQVKETTTLKQGYNIYEVSGIDVNESIKNVNVNALGVFIPLQSGNLSVYIGRVYLGYDNYGSMFGDVNLYNKLKSLYDFNIIEKINFIYNANSPTILVSPNNDRYKLDITDDGVISAKKISFKKPLFLGNSFVSHSPNESIGWTPTKAWGMAAETEEKDFVHSLFNKIKMIDSNAEIADIINIVPFEQNPNMDLSVYDYINAIDFDCIFLKIGENVSNFENLDLKIIDLFDNHILQEKKNIPIFVASMFSSQTKTNNVYEYSMILKKVSDYYHTPFSWIDVNTGTATNIYNAVTTPIPPKPDGSQWDKSQVQENVLYGHPGNIGHEYIANMFYDSMCMYYKLYGKNI